MLDWFNGRDAHNFGTSLAEFFMERVPLDNTTRKKASFAKKQEALEKIFTKVILYKQQNKLNVYKKAKLGNGFKWKLLEANYDPEFVDELTRMLMLKI